MARSVKAEEIEGEPETKTQTRKGPWKAARPRRRWKAKPREAASVSHGLPKQTH